jgi:hypothetical protein
MQSGDTNGETVIEIEMEREIGSCILVFGYLSVSFVICQFVVRCSVREAVFVGCLVAFLFVWFVCLCARVSRNEANTAESKRGNAQLRGTVIMDSAYF